MVRFGPADRVTLTRAVVACGVAGIVVASVGAQPSPAARATLVALSVVALLLDAVDGWVARRTHTTSDFGAHFDPEVDAFLILVLSVHVAPRLGWWVLAIGLAHYGLHAARIVTPRLRGQVPARRWRKAVAALQGIVLTAAAGQALPVPAAQLALAVALALLAASFGTEALALARRAPNQPPAREHPIGGAVVTAVAGLLVWTVLALPETLVGLRPLDYAAVPLRIPLEGLVVVALLLALRGRAHTVMATTVGLALGLLVLVRLLDVGFTAALYRRFNPVTDWRYLGSAKDLLGDSVGAGPALAAMTGAALLLVGLLLVLVLSVGRLARVVARHRRRSLRGVIGLGAAWTLCAALGVGLGVGARLPAAASSTAALAVDEVTRAGANLSDRAAFAQALAVDSQRSQQVPSSAGLLEALRGKDVIIVVVESYGEVAVDGSVQVGAALDATSKDLAGVGYHGRSGWLTSPTFGGISWLAHSTLQSGLWVDSEQRYDQLLRADRITLTSSFARAGWRTVSLDPANLRDWPEGKAFYHYDQLYDSRTVGYRGPRFGYAPVPDQFSLAAFDRLELARPGRPRVMAEINLVSSHVPWAPLPHLVDPAVLGDGSVFTSQLATATPRATVWSTPSGIRAAYDASIAYSLHSIASFVSTVHSDDLVLVVLGDHQPATVVSGAGASHDVPISIISKDPAVLERVAGWKWRDGLTPKPGDPVWPMDQFRDRFLDAFGAVHAVEAAQVVNH